MKKIKYLHFCFGGLTVWSLEEEHSVELNYQKSGQQLQGQKEGV